MSEPVADELHQRMGQNNCVNLAVVEDCRVNERIHVIEGPFADGEALLLSGSGEESVIVLIQIVIV